MNLEIKTTSRYSVNVWAQELSALKQQKILKMNEYY